METCDFNDVASICLREIDRAKGLPDWDKVWSEENTPPYFNNSIIRYHQKFLRAPGEEQHHLRALLRDLVPKGATVHEFGCGPGMNLEYLRKRGNKVYGYEKSASALETVNKRGIPAVMFDMMSPGGKLFPETDFALTVHALEQLEDATEFMNWLRSIGCKRAIHIEPIYELYDPYNMVDRLGMMWHDARGYVKGLPKLVVPKELHRTWIGGMMHEAYSVMVWSPS